MSRKTELTLLNELAWALYTSVMDAEKSGHPYGYGSTSKKALRRYFKEGPKDKQFLDTTNPLRVKV